MGETSRNERYTAALNWMQFDFVVDRFRRIKRNVSRDYYQKRVSPINYAIKPVAPFPSIRKKVIIPIYQNKIILVLISILNELDNGSYAGGTV